MTDRFHFDFGRAPRGARREPEAPMRLLLLGDFSGSNERPPLVERAPLRIDLDNFEKIVKRLAPRIASGIGEVRIESLEDFHPDALFKKLELFRALRAARSQPPPAGDSPFAALIGAAPSAKPAAAAPALNALDEMIRRVVAPHIVPDRQAETRSYVGAIDAAIAEQMRQLLHDPAFQSREAAWRGVRMLVSALELDESLQLHLFDVSREELIADLEGCEGKIEQSGIYRALVERWRSKSGDEGWSALVGLYRFGPSEADIALLAALGVLAAHAGGPFIADGDPALAQADRAVAAAWGALRKSETAPWIGLVAPRLLMRSPYGARDDSIEAFEFEELGNRPAHAQYLWGSGALACALLLGRGFTADGWSSSPGDEREIDDLPTSTRVDTDGERELVPGAEFFHSDREAQALLDAGLMPLRSDRQRNAALLMRFQSIAAPATALAGLPA